LNRVYFLYLFLMSLATGLPALATDDGSSAGQECESMKQLPLVDTIRKESKETFDEWHETIRKIGELERACNQNRQSRQGAGRAAFVAAGQAVSAQNQKYQAAYQKLLGNINKAKPAVQALNERSCLENLSRTARTHGPQAQADMRSKIRNACDEGTAQDRADRAAGDLLGGDGGNGNNIRDALLNPRQNRELSERLNAEAREWGSQHGLNPGGGPCGEKCVSILRAKRIYEQYGATPEYHQALAAAASTRVGIYGRSTLTRSR
jgi:hypothetical protein